jgi:hypothetical protein
LAAKEKQGQESTPVRTVLHLVPAFIAVVNRTGPRPFVNLLTIVDVSREWQRNRNLMVIGGQMSALVSH